MTIENSFGQRHKLIENCMLIVAPLLVIPGMHLPAQILIIAALVLSSPEWLKGLKDGKIFVKGSVASAMLLYITAHIIAMAWASDTGKAWFEVEKKLALIGLPLIFYVWAPNITVRMRVGFMVVLALVLSFLGFELHAIQRFAEKGWSWDFGYYFFGQNLLFSSTGHRVYVAWWAATGFFLILSGFYLKLFFRHIWWVVAGLMLLFEIYCLEARQVIGCTVLTFAVFLWVERLRISKMGKHYSRLSIALLVVGISVFLVMPKTQKALQFYKANSAIAADSIDMDNGFSARIILAKASISVLKDNWLLGTGTGGVEPVMVKALEEQGSTFLAKKKMNAHNQVFHTFMETGIIGLLAIYFLFYTLFRLYFKGGRPTILLYFSLITLICMLTECVLNVQKGIIFFSYFALLFASCDKQETGDSFASER